MLKTGALSAFVLAVTKRDKRTYVTHASKYNFNPLVQEIELQDDDGRRIGQIDLTQKDILKVDIYDKADPVHNYVQTILSGRNTV